MTFLTMDQFSALGKKCSHCDKKATWIAHKDSPAYCDEHFPYNEEINAPVVDQEIAHLENGQLFIKETVVGTKKTKEFNEWLKGKI